MSDEAPKPTFPELVSLAADAVAGRATAAVVLGVTMEANGAGASFQYSLRGMTVGLTFLAVENLCERIIESIGDCRCETCRRGLATARMLHATVGQHLGAPTEKRALN
jgi:hypothetical protein